MKRRPSRCKDCGQVITWLKVVQGQPVAVNGNVYVQGGYWDLRMGSHQQTCPARKNQPGLFQKPEASA